MVIVDAIVLNNANTSLLLLVDAGFNSVLLIIAARHSKSPVALLDSTDHRRTSKYVSKTYKRLQDHVNASLVVHHLLK